LHLVGSSVLLYLSSGSLQVVLAELMNH